MRKFQLIAVVGAAAAASAAMAAGTSFGSATVVDGSGIPASTPAVVSGALDASGNQAAVYGPLTLFQNIPANFNAANTLNIHNITGLTPGVGFRVETALAAGQASYDTRLRVRNSANTVLGNDDDGGGAPFSRVNGTVPGDGNLEATVTYWTDSSYTGTHAQSGWYDLNVYQAALITPATYGTNVQWWRFENLVGGDVFSAEAIFASFPGSFSGNDTVMAAYDSSGVFLDSDDDGAGSGGLSMLTGTIPLDGVVYIAVTSYQGSSSPGAATFLNENANTRTGPLTIAFIPAPGSIALLGLGGLIAGRRRRA